MIQQEVRISNELGLHARAAARLVQLAGRFQSTIRLVRPDTGQRVNGKSILGVLLLAAARGTILALEIEGQDEAEAMAAIRELIESRFGEEK